MLKFLQLYTFFFTILNIASHGQDFQFTQFYAAPIYLNPGFAGSTKQTRVNNNNRIQWTGLTYAKSYNTYSVSADHYLKKYKSGIGMIANYNSAGSGDLRSVELGVVYAYHIDISEKWKIRPGLQASLVSRSIDFNKLLFGDQIYKDGIAPLSQDRLSSPTKNFFDFSSGFVLYNKNLWLGFAGHHLNSPNQSLAGEKSILPPTYTFHGGYKIFLTDKSPYKKSYTKKPESSISPAFLYKSQGKFDQLDIGLYFYFEPLVLGVFYRGLPLLKAYKKGYGNSDAVAALIGIRLGSFNFGYSYDITVSKLAVYNSGGSHEISLCYIFDMSNGNRKKPAIDKSKMVLPCPDF
jgi:type IX secretion system PorP/SprF family membrane protein